MKYGGTAAAMRLAFLIICAVFLTMLRGTAPPVAMAQAESPATPEEVTFTQNFNAVTPPALPTGWTTAQTGSGTNFVTVGPTATNASNSVFTSNPATPGSAELVSLPIMLDAAPTRLSFRHHFVTEPDPGYDGGVLEISI